MSKITVIYFVDTNNRSPVKEFIDKLSKKQQDKIMRAIYPVEEFGIGTHLRNTKKLIGTDLWEIRILGKDSMRIIYALEIRNAILILHVFVKKSQRALAKKAKTTQARICELEGQNANPSLATLKRISGALGIKFHLSI